MELTIAAFGERCLGLMVTAGLFVLSSSPIFHQNPWYCEEVIVFGIYKIVLYEEVSKLVCLWFFCRVPELGFSCTPAIYKVLKAPSIVFSFF